jgi:asparagine synthase (glutamine-hydrolysing)
MCGIAGVFGPGWNKNQLRAMSAAQRHRGPDDQGLWTDFSQGAGLAHNRLSILDLSPAGRQPMWSANGRFAVVFNGEIYNYLELRAELADYPFQTGTDTEVLLAAFERWGEDCLRRFLGMFSFLLWDSKERKLFAARDRFGVKPLYYHLQGDGTLLASSEIKALHAAGVEAEPDAATWAAYLAHGLYEHSARTFWKGILALPAGHLLTWANGRLELRRWYDLAAGTGTEFDARPEAEVKEEYLALLKESVRLRFRSDVPAGINLSGGLDSSTLFALVQAVQGPESSLFAFTFTTGDERYDELPWVRQMLNGSRHPLVDCRLEAKQVPELAASIHSHQDEPFGGIPTLAYARVFEEARARGVIVLLDGQGLDEQWAGYDYYRKSIDGGKAGMVQGTTDSPVRPDCLVPEFAALAEPWTAARRFPDELRNTQYRDACHTKIPRALRFNDRVSMRSSTELREPFLDHRLFELALRQPAGRKIASGVHKKLLRDMTANMLPKGLVEAPKRALQTPQREWLRGPLRGWAEEQIECAVAAWGGSWIRPAAVRPAWEDYLQGKSDNSFYVWQWFSLAWMSNRLETRLESAHV